MLTNTVEISSNDNVSNATNCRILLLQLLADEYSRVIISITNAIRPINNFNIKRI